MPPIDLPHGATYLVDSNEMSGNHQGYLLDPMEVCKLPVGDYSIRLADGTSLEKHVVVERKSFNNMLGEFTVGRRRWEAALERLSVVPRAFVVIETTWGRMRRGRYPRTRLSKDAACGSMVAWALRFGVQFWWAGDRHEGERLTRWLLTRAAKDSAKLFSERKDLFSQ